MRIQILTALIAYLLIALFARAQRLTASLWHILSELTSTLFQRPQLDRDRHRRWRQQQSFIAACQPDLFA